MNRDPYEVLGVAHGASMDEVRKAYKELVKKYHPDKYAGNPLEELAKEKLQEVNEAYDYLVKNEGKTGNGGNYYNSGNAYNSGSGNYGNGGYGGYAGVYNQVRAAINRNDLMTAEDLLINNAPHRDAEWFFLSGIVSCKKGYIVDGLANIKQAMDLDPNNEEYRNAYSQMSQAGQMYQNYSNQQGYDQEQMGPMFCPLPCFCLPCCC